MATYFQKLKDPRWQKKRLEALSKNDFSCEVCGDCESTLHVHHKEYFKGHEPWDYDLTQLAVLCESCHQEQHHNADVLKLICSTLPLDGPGSRSDVAMLLAGFCNISYEFLLNALDAEDCGYIKARHNLGKQFRDQSGY